MSPHRTRLKAKLDELGEEIAAARDELYKSVGMGRETGGGIGALFESVNEWTAEATGAHDSDDEKKHDRHVEIGQALLDDLRAQRAAMGKST